VTIQLRLPEQGPQISLSGQQQLALGADSGVQLLLGAAGSGRSATALMAAQLAVAKVGLADVWVISASRTGASQFREKLISINPATTPRVLPSPHWHMPCCEHKQFMHQLVKLI
jgi:hypothetical protein